MGRYRPADSGVSLSGAAQQRYRASGRDQVSCRTPRSATSDRRIANVFSTSALLPTRGALVPRYGQRQRGAVSFSGTLDSHVAGIVPFALRERSAGVPESAPVRLPGGLLSTAICLVRPVRLQ